MSKDNDGNAKVVKSFLTKKTNIIHYFSTRLKACFGGFINVVFMKTKETNFESKTEALITSSNWPWEGVWNGLTKKDNLHDKEGQIEHQHEATSINVRLYTHDEKVVSPLYLNSQTTQPLLNTNDFQGIYSVFGDLITLRIATI